LLVRLVLKRVYLAHQPLSPLEMLVVDQDFDTTGLQHGTSRSRTQSLWWWL